MHLHFCFEGIPTEKTPAAMLKYYRQRKGLTTRQLAESIGVVPATVLMYERERFPIPYQTAVAMAIKSLKLIEICSSMSLLNLWIIPTMTSCEKLGRLTD